NRRRSAVICWPCSSQRAAPLYRGERTARDQGPTALSVADRPPPRVRSRPTAAPGPQTHATSRGCSCGCGSLSIHFPSLLPCQERGLLENGNTKNLLRRGGRDVRPHFGHFR